MLNLKLLLKIYPEISVGNLSRLSYTKPNCTITDEDLDKTILNLQKRMSKWEPSDQLLKKGIKSK